MQTLRPEYLDDLVILSERHLGHVVKEFVAHYHAERPHQAKGNMPIPEADEPEPRILTFPTGEMKCESGSVGC